MFNEKSVLEEIAQNMSQQLKKNAEHQNELIKAVDNLDKSAQILDELGLYSASNSLLDVLASIK